MQPIRKFRLLVFYRVLDGLTQPETLCQVLYQLLPLLLQDRRYLYRLFLADVRKPTRGDHLRASHRPMRRRPQQDTVLRMSGLLLDLFNALP